MIDKERIKKAQQNLAQYLRDRLIKKEKNETAKTDYSALEKVSNPLKRVMGAA